MRAWLIVGWMLFVALPAYAAPKTSAKQGHSAKPQKGCPATWAEAKGECGTFGGGPLEGTECKYPEGSCTCAYQSPCSGIEQPRPQPGSPISWICKAKPPKVRADGCPGVQPNPSSPCTRAGQSCSYGDCCIYRMTCTKGHWVPGGMSCPP